MRLVSVCTNRWPHSYQNLATNAVVVDEDQMGEDFVRDMSTSHVRSLLMARIIQTGFLRNLVRVFPNLATRPLYLTGESYAGTYIVRWQPYM